MAPVRKANGHLRLLKMQVMVVQKPLMSAARICATQGVRWSAIRAAGTSSMCGLVRQRGSVKWTTIAGSKRRRWTTRWGFTEQGE